jgi:hypothetical protein
MNEVDAVGGPALLRRSVEPVAAAIGDDEALAPATSRVVHDCLGYLGVFLEQHRVISDRVPDRTHRAVGTHPELTVPESEPTGGLLGPVSTHPGTVPVVHLKSATRQQIGASPWRICRCDRRQFHTIHLDWAL